MTKNQLIDLVRDNLASDTPRELKAIYHPKIVEKYLEMAFDSLYSTGDTQREQLASEYGLSNWIYDSMTKVYSLPVNYDSTRDKYYSDIPVGIMSVNNNSGVRMVYPIKSELSAFLPRRQADNFLLGDLEVNSIGGFVYYILEGQKLWYSGDTQLVCRLHKEPQNVLAKLAVKFSVLEPTDEITIPDGKNDDIFQSVWNFMRLKKPEDLTNDTTPNQP